VVSAAVTAPAISAAKKAVIREAED